jgi:cupin 2 domain-containing protein
MANLFKNIPDNLTDEHFSALVKAENIRIERIVSLGHSSPETGWYDQDENEWVIVLEGSGTLQYADGSKLVLNKGDYVNIPAHSKHKVSRTDPDQMTIWLAVFYR